MSKILTGVLRGRKIQSISLETLRPSQGILREALINTLASYLSFDFSSLDVLDLFAGLGLVGFELLSNGAKSLTYVEANPRLTKLLKSNACSLGLDSQVQVVQGLLPEALQRLSKREFNLVFLDPPYWQKESDAKLLFETFQKLIDLKILAEAALIVCEYNNQESLNQLQERFGGQVSLLKFKKFGESILWIGEYKS